jgi:hypothetical protein
VARLQPASSCSRFDPQNTHVLCCHQVQDGDSKWESFLHKRRGVRSLLQVVLLRDPIDRLVSQVTRFTPRGSPPGVAQGHRGSGNRAPCQPDPR